MNAPPLTTDEKITIARLRYAAALRGPVGLRFEVMVAGSDLRVALAALECETERANRFQRERAELADQLHGTPCAQIAWQQERDALRDQLDKAAEALKRETERADRERAGLAEWQQWRDDITAQLDKTVEALRSWQR